MTAYEKYCSVVSILDEYVEKGIITYCPPSDAEIENLRSASEEDRVCVPIYIHDWVLESGEDFIQARCLGSKLRTADVLPAEVFRDYVDGGTFFNYNSDKNPNIEFYLVLPPYLF